MVAKKIGAGETPRSTFRLHPRIMQLLREMSEEDAKNMTAFIEDLIRQEAKRRHKSIKEQSE